MLSVVGENLWVGRDKQGCRDLHYMIIIAMININDGKKLIV